MSSEIERIRAALARGATLDNALHDHANPATGMSGLTHLHRHVSADVDGVGPLLHPYLTAPGVTDVLVGAGQVWIDRGEGLENMGVTLREPDVRAIAVRMAANAGRRLDDASPIVDATLADGTRLNAVLPPLSADGTLICLRTRRRHAFSIEELVNVGTIPPDLAPLLTALVQARISCLVSGATGTGKTTILAALLSLVSPRERIVCIEEASELMPNHPHVIHLQERGANVQGVGAVSMTELVRAALRMRPDRIVLGECRGPEVREVFSAFNTGHEGGWATIHANTPADVPARLTALGALAGMDDLTVATQAASALSVVIHLRRHSEIASGIPSHVLNEVSTASGDKPSPSTDSQTATVAEKTEGNRARRIVDSVALIRRDTNGTLTCVDAVRVGAGGQLIHGPGRADLDALLAVRCGRGQ